MRKATFEVPNEVIGDFTEKLTQLELDNSIVGTNEEEEIIIEVHYEKEEARQVDELEDFLEALKDSLEEVDDDADDDNED